MSTINTTPAAATVMWQRLDMPGHECCRFSRMARQGWLVEGSAVFLENNAPASLHYQLLCDEGWQTREASVQGWLGQQRILVVAKRDAENRWTVEGKEQPEFDGLLDIDLGFTPATNTNAMKRMQLSVGEEQETVAVWLDTRDWTMKKLPQLYRRETETEYSYASPLHDYHARLRVDDFSLVMDYPGLWQCIAVS